eukprot:1537409-Rhodomonas_salina.3
MVLASRVLKQQTRKMERRMDRMNRVGSVGSSTSSQQSAQDIVPEAERRQLPEAERRQSMECPMKLIVNIPRHAVVGIKTGFHTNLSTAGAGGEGGEGGRCRGRSAAVCRKRDWQGERKAERGELFTAQPSSLTSGLPDDVESEARVTDHGSEVGAMQGQGLEIKRQQGSRSMGGTLGVGEEVSKSEKEAPTPPI